MKTLTTKRATRRIAASIAIATALAAAQTALAATAIYWKGGNGSETNPANIYSKSSWTASDTYSGSDISKLPYSTHNMHFGFASGAEDTTAWLKCDGTTDSTVIANLFRTLSGHFIFTTGSFKTASNFSIGHASGDNSTVTKKSGDWTIGGTLYIGFGDNSTGTLEVDGGSISVSGNTYIGNSGTGALTINGGMVEIASGNSTTLGVNSGSSGTINLNGGVLKTKRVAKDNGSGTLNFNGGTLHANADNTTDFIGSGVTVNVNGGGVVDCGGNAIKINASLNGTGGLLFTGGNRIDIGNVGINYANATAVTPGTTLAVGQYGAMNNILSSERGLVVAGVPTAGQTIFILTRGGGYTISADQLAYVTCPVAPETTFALGEGNTNIVVQSVGSIAPAFYIGPADGDLSVAANWSDGVVPTSGNPVIWCANPATLIVGDTFRADTITIPEYSSVVTISAGNLHLAALTNASNLAIAQGASLTIDGDLVGYAADNTKPLLYSNYGTVTVGGKVHFRDCSNVNKALSTVAQYAVADANSTPIIASGLAYNAVWNESANNWYQDYLVANLGSMNNAPGKWVVGANGLKFPASRTIDQSGFAVKGSQAVTLYSSADWTLDESSRHKGNDLYLRDTATVTIDTTDYNDHTTPRTVTLKGYVNATGSAATPLTITGNGTVVLDAIPANNRTNIVNGAIAVENGATLQINKDVVVGGTGSISLAAGTTLALPANDDKTFSVRDIVPLTLPTEGTATLRIDGARLKSGDYVILDSVPTGYAEHLTVTGTAIDGRRTELKDDGTSLILTIVPRGFIISVF